jgi:glycosyltransferase involved in cell wall biosynthesis
MMESQVFLSIVIPTRNRPKSLPFSVKSALNLIQTIPGEVIVVSNGQSLASDLSGLEEETRNKCVIVRSDERLSLSQNWAFGFRQCRGEWITLLGDDDILDFKDGNRLHEFLAETTESGIRFRSGSFRWTQDGEYLPNSFLSPKVTKEIKRLETPISDKKWHKLQPRNYPCGAGASLLRKSWIDDLDSKGLLFSAFSPDWFTASLFIYAFSSYIQIEEIWAFTGEHPFSAMAQQRDPNGRIAKEELKLNPYSPHKLLQFKDAIYPTTWLARMDSLIRAREINNLPIELKEREFIKSALRTTPRYIFKVRPKLLNQFPDHKGAVNFFSVVFLPGSIFRSISRIFKVQFGIGFRRKSEVLGSLFRT